MPQFWKKTHMHTHTPRYRAILLCINKFFFICRRRRATWQHIYRIPTTMPCCEIIATVIQFYNKTRTHTHTCQRDRTTTTTTTMTVCGRQRFVPALQFSKTHTRASLLFVFMIKFIMITVWIEFHQCCNILFKMYMCLATISVWRQRYF